MSGDHLAKACPACAGATPADGLMTGCTFLPLGKQAVPVSLTWQPVTPSAGTQVLAYRLTEQEPAKDLTRQAIVTRRQLGKGSITAIYSPIFREYFRGHFSLATEVHRGTCPAIKHHLEGDFGCPTAARGSTAAEG